MKTSHNTESITVITKTNIMGPGILVELHWLGGPIVTSQVNTWEQAWEKAWEISVYPVK